MNYNNVFADISLLNGFVMTYQTFKWFLIRVCFIMPCHSVRFVREKLAKTTEIQAFVTVINCPPSPNVCPCPPQFHTLQQQC
jgi:hypothetical protein